MNEDIASVRHTLMRSMAVTDGNLYPHEAYDEGMASLSRVESELARLREENGSLRLRLEAGSHQHAMDNAFLITGREAAEAELARLQDGLRGLGSVARLNPADEWTFGMRTNVVNLARALLGSTEDTATEGGN